MAVAYLLHFKSSLATVFAFLLGLGGASGGLIINVHIAVGHDLVR